MGSFKNYKYIVTGILRHPITWLSNIPKLWDYSMERFNLKETFIEGEYYWLYKMIKPNTILIDIGAGIGETPIYFAMNENVKKVVAFEPIPKVYRNAKANIEGSPYKEKIKLHNAGISDKQSEIYIGKNFRGTPSTRLYEASSNDGEKVPIYTLNKVIKELGTKAYKIAIKSDCEGEEAVLFDKAELRNVYAMQLEYHGPEIAKHLKELLENKGFIVNEMKSDGLICAYRKNNNLS